MRFARLLLALFANAPQTQTVMRRQKSELARRCVLKRLNFRREKFDDRAAIGANQMVVMLVIIMMLVISFVVTETDFARKPGFGQEFERAVNRCMSDRRILLLHQPVKVFARQMLFGAQKDFQDKIALRGAAQARFLNVFEEKIFFRLKVFVFFRLRSKLYK